MAETSPSWKKPSDVMKKRILKRKSSLSQTPEGRSIPRPHISQAATSPRQGRSGKKRQNPFASGGIVKKLCSDDQVTINNHVVPVASSSSLFDVLNKVGQTDSVKENEKQLVEQRNMNEVLAHISSPLTSVENRTSDIANKQPAVQKQDATDKEEVEDEIKGYRQFPTDWSLKSRLRYISSQPYSWCYPLKSAEECAGLIEYVQQTEQEVKAEVSGASREAKIEFQKGCMVWMHPHLPWFKLFPRIVSDSKIGRPSQVFHSPEVQKSLLNDWSESFSSVFHLLRSKKCNFFYLCAHHFTALFRGIPVPGLSEEIHVILTPTSRGFRESLKKEGVEFSMPLNTIEKVQDNEEIECEPKKPRQSIGKARDGENKEVTDTDQNTDDADIEETDEGASSWLETLGIDKKKYRSLDPNKVKLQREIYKIIDNRPESAILVEGADTMALFNFLLNCRSCVDNTGDLAGVPPTILAPVAFKGATLKSHQVKQGTVHQQLKSGSVKEGYSVEITGPIFPTHIHRLNKLFQSTQQEYSLTCSVQDTSTPFNMFHPEKTENQIQIDDLDGDNEGIVMGGVVGCAINDINNGRQSIREMVQKEGLFTWS